jgi:hypothetical protein
VIQVYYSPNFSEDTQRRQYAYAYLVFGGLEMVPSMRVRNHELEQDDDRRGFAQNQIRLYNCSCDTSVRLCLLVVVVVRHWMVDEHHATSAIQTLPFTHDNWWM